MTAELGCGPGRVTAHLRNLGLDVFGVDLSPVMIELAREAYPDLRFEVGSMDALDLADGELNGIVSWYPIIHTHRRTCPRTSPSSGGYSRQAGTSCSPSSTRRANRSRRSTTR